MAFERIETENGSLTVRTEGTGPAVLLLHGWTLDGTMWEPQIAGLKEDYRLIVPDRRGHGRSEAVSDASLEVGDILQILDAFDVGTVAIVGMSQGGRIGLRFSALHPDRVRALVLLGSSADGIAAPDDPGAIPLAKYRAMLSAGEVEAFRRDWLDHPLMQGGDAEIARQCREMVMRYRGEDLTLAETANALPPPPDYARFETPVLVLCGSRDTAGVRYVADRLASEIPAAQRAVIKDAGHLVNLTHPAQVNAAIAEFLQTAEG